MEIKLSQTTKKIVKQLKKVKSFSIEMPHAFSSAVLDRIESTALVIWLMSKQEVSKETKFLLESLYAALLEDIQNSLLKHTGQKKKGFSFWSTNAKSIFLAVAGTIFFGCEGFDGMFAMLGIYSLPTL